MRAFLVLLAVLLAACGAPEPPLVVSELEITKPMPGRQMSAGYLVLTNNTDEPLRITSVESPQFGRVEVHETTIEDGVSRMRELAELIVPAHGSVRLQRGGKHLMLMRPADLDDGVALQFFSGDTPVLSVDYPFPEEEDR